MSKTNSSSERSRKRRKLSPPTEADKVADREEGRHNNSENGSMAPTEVPSVKDLASSEASSRRVALKNIITHLQQRPADSSLTLTECLQLWKGFFVSIYMHDSKNALSVQNLLREIASTFQIFDSKDDEIRVSETKPRSDDHVPRDSCFNRYHTAFWQILVKEWSGIDSHRLNKYLLLVRFVMRELTTICLRSLFERTSSSSNTETNGESRKREAKSETEKGGERTAEELAQAKTQAVTDVLQTVGPLNAKDRKIPDGLRLHLLDVYVAETFSALLSIAGNGTDTAKEPRSAAIQQVLEALQSPVLAMSQSDSGAPKHVRTKAKEILEEFATREEEAKENP